MSEQLPTFLIIGAMKAGTTTLFRDLERDPACYFAIDKEPGDLETDDVLTPQGRARYAAKYAKAHPEQHRGDASTTYTKIPEFTGCAQRARQVLGSEIKLVYIAREPIARATSQHYHEFGLGFITERNADTALRTIPRILDYSRYAMQLEPWVETFGLDALHVVRFEDYMADRAAGYRAMASHIGLDPDAVPASDAAYNVGDTKMVLPGPLRAVWRSWPYQKIVRPAMKGPVRKAVEMVMPKSPPRPAPPSPDTVAWALEQIAPDQARLADLLGDKAPAWDAEATLAKARQRVQ